MDLRFGNVEVSQIPYLASKNNIKDHYCDKWIQNDDFFTIGTLGYQIMTIPETGTYRFIACGAGYENSMGAIVRCDINLKRGKKICFTIGQQGSWECRGGCGATIVAEVEENSKVSFFHCFQI